jgi:hypothetical protein
MLPSCADLEPEVVLPVLAIDDVEEGVRGLRHGDVLSLTGPSCAASMANRPVLLAEAVNTL